MVETAPAGSEVGIAALKSGIAAANSAYDNVSKVAKQFTEAIQSNFEAVAKQVVNGAKSFCTHHSCLRISVIRHAPL